MKIVKLAEGILVSDQILPEDLKAVASQGVKSILCHRPDGEGEDQPNFEEIQKTANELKIKAYYLPVVAGKITDDEVAEFTKIFSEADKPVLGFCRTGMRATSLWALSHANSIGLAKVISAGKDAGYDLSGLTERILGSNS